MEYLIIIGIILVILVVVLILIKNKLIEKTNKIDNAFSSMDVYLKKRYDLVPNLVNTVKGYMNHEKEMLENITKLRTEIYNCHDERLVDESNRLEKELFKLFGIAEDYPELKANENFLDLQNKMDDIENDIAAARRTYNAHVNNYNIYISKFPVVCVSGLLGYKKKELFVIPEEQRHNKNWMDE